MESQLKYSPTTTKEDNTMVYRKFTPCAYDRHIPIAERENWLVAPVTRHRDSDVLTEANWESQLEFFSSFLHVETDEYSDDAEIRTFSHWAVGWVEILLINPIYKEKVEFLIEKLENYPILDEELYSQKMDSYASETWKSMSLCEKIKLCHDNNLSIFQAREEFYPYDLWDCLTSGA